MAQAKARTAAPVEEVGGEIEVGSLVRFLGYDEAVEEAEQILEEGASYPVVEVVTNEDGEVEAYVVELPNPDFNAKKKEHPETNPKMLETEVLPEEVELSDEEGEEAEEAEEAEAEAAPAPTAKGKAAAKPAAKTTAAKAEAKAEPKATATKGKAAAKTEEAPATGKGKAAAKPAGKAETKPAGKGKAAAKVEEPETPAEPIDPDAVPDLENESEEVLALVSEATDVDSLIEVAQGLEEQTAHNDFLLGGVLYHIKKDGGWKDMDERYREKGGFSLFVSEHFNVEYRKAQYLVGIYVEFTQAGIENPAEYVARIGWTKAMKIHKYLNQPEVDVDGLLQTAEENTVSDLSTIISEQFAVGGTGGTPGDKKKRVTLKFRYVEEEATTVESIIHEAMEQFGLKEPEALLQILTDWHSMNAVESGAVGEIKEEGKPVAKTTKATAGKPATKPAPRTAKARA